MRLKCLILPIICSIRARPIKKLGEKLGLINRVGAMRDNRADAALSRSFPIAFRIIAFVSNDGSWIDVGAKTGQHFEIAAIARLAAFWYNLSPPLTMWT